MEIHEITKLGFLTEAGLLDTIKAKFSSDPALAGLSTQQRVAQMARDSQTRAVAKAALQSWNARVVNLMRANNNQPLTPQQYQNNLRAYVDKVVFGDNLEGVDPNIKNNIDQLILNASSKSANPADFEKAFEQLMIVSTAAAAAPPAAAAGLSKDIRVIDRNIPILRYQTNDFIFDRGTGTWKLNDPTGRASKRALPAEFASFLSKQAKIAGINLPETPPATARPAPPAAPAPTAAPAPAATPIVTPQPIISADTKGAQQLLQSLINQRQQSGLQQYLQGATVKSTGNSAVDGLLTALGVKIR